MSTAGVQQEFTFSLLFLRENGRCLILLDNFDDICHIFYMEEATSGGGQAARGLISAFVDFCELDQQHTRLGGLLACFVIRGLWEEDFHIHNTATIW